MSLLAASLAGAKYQVSTNEERESSTNGAAEFQRRKKWPEVLLKELVGCAVFCIKPSLRPDSQQFQNGEAWSWRTVYASPSVTEMLGKRPNELEGKDFLDLVLSHDRPQLESFFNTLLAPPLLNINPQTISPLTSTHLGESHTTYIRMISRAPPISRSNSGTNSGYNSGSSYYGTPSGSGRVEPIIWEIKGHATGIGEDLTEGSGGGDTLRMGADGTVIPGAGAESSGKHKAIWLMGRRVGEGATDEQQSHDAFLEVKLENERLQAELRDLQIEYGVDPAERLYRGGDAGSDASSPRSDTTEPATDVKQKGKAGRPPKSGIKPSALGSAKKQKAAGRDGVKDGETMYVCVTCGRTDSPEWRKGPLGPKTLCNACGLRWAKRNGANNKKPPKP
ncbi:hypothetical protein L202_04161 [Cryptococcus amylolentus CBS 6039]|uniref:GATA-type domain-containing protein n=3 Tax=Cryptococcus amylolentus TaxID=104669 RepID=A0A1E3HQD5_9TREE|nr:hypothetical protein L202_04161 [Cryptococcus amylolentus CBS 6039]ODN78544.1 hypothetical protein L202_04161 [Cryptococcus amylolentus CBS 6039]ODO06893.1 hypothetical protein I350_04253 [Cryptococcus amylolentus CBS 6273]